MSARVSEVAVPADAKIYALRSRTISVKAFGTWTGRRAGKVRPPSPIGPRGPPAFMILTATTLPSSLQNFVREGLWRLERVICLSKPRSPITGFGVFVSVPPRGFAVHFDQKYRIPLSSTATGMSITGGSVKNVTLSTFRTCTICEMSFPYEFIQGHGESEVCWNSANWRPCCPHAY